MGICSSTDNTSDVALQSEDPPVATVDEDRAKPEASDLNKPAVDVSAPLDRVDAEKSTIVAEQLEPAAQTSSRPAEEPEAVQPDAGLIVGAGQLEPAEEAGAVKGSPELATEDGTVKDSAAPEDNAKESTKEEDKEPKAQDQDGVAEATKVAAEEATKKKAPVKKKQADHAVKKKKEESNKKRKEEEGAPKKAEGEAPKKAELTDEQKFRAAAENGDDKAVAAMLKAGVDVNCADADGKTALHIAAAKGFADMIGRLTNAKKVKVGATIVSTKDTPLHLACQGGHRDCAVLIVRGGALFRSGPQQAQQTAKLCNAKNKAGKTPAQVSTDNQLGQWLQSANPASSDPPWQKKRT